MAFSPIGDYQPGTTLLHRLPVGAKLLGRLLTLDPAGDVVGQLAVEVEGHAEGVLRLLVHLVDAGAEYRGYAADITRTFPVDGRFTPEQRAIYQLGLTGIPVFNVNNNCSTGSSIAARSIFHPCGTNTPKRTLMVTHLLYGAGSAVACPAARCSRPNAIDLRRMRETFVISSGPRSRRTAPWMTRFMVISAGSTPLMGPDATHHRRPRR